MKRTFSAAQRAEGKIRTAIARLAGKYPFHVSVLEQFAVTEIGRPTTTQAWFAPDWELVL
jgi:hypothetical protein